MAAILSRPQWVNDQVNRVDIYLACGLAQCHYLYQYWFIGPLGTKFYEISINIDVKNMNTVKSLV